MGAATGAVAGAVGYGIGSAVASGVAALATGTGAMGGLALASVWSPSLSFNMFGIDVEIGAEVLSVGVKSGKTTDSFTFGFSAMFGGTIKISW